MAITNAAITSTATAVYTSNGDNAITTLIVCNKAEFIPATPTLGQTTLSLYAVTSGGSADDTLNLIANKLVIPAGETVTFDQEKLVLSNGQKIMAKSASPENLVITISTLPV